MSLLNFAIDESCYYVKNRTTFTILHNLVLKPSQKQELGGFKYWQMVRFKPTSLDYPVSYIDATNCCHHDSTLAWTVTRCPNLVRWPNTPWRSTSFDSLELIYILVSSFFSIIVIRDLYELFYWNKYCIVDSAVFLHFFLLLSNRIRCASYFTHNSQLWRPFFTFYSSLESSFRELSNTCLHD